MRWGLGAEGPLFESLAVTELDSRPYNADFWDAQSPQLYGQYLVLLFNRHVIIWDWNEDVVLVWSLSVRTEISCLQFPYLPKARYFR